MPKERDKSPPPPLPTKRTVLAKEFKDYITLFYGPPGTGKSTFVNDLADSVLFVSTDRGSRHLNATRREVTSWGDVLQLYRQLEADGAPRYDVICFDHVDDVMNMLEDHLLVKFGVDNLTDKRLPFGKGWRELKRGILQLIQRTFRLNAGICFIAHESQKDIEFAGRTINMWQPRMTKTARDLLWPICDLIGFVNLKSVKNKETKETIMRRYMITQPTDEVYAKDRTVRIRPDGGIEKLDGKAFRSTFNGNQKQGNEHAKPNEQRRQRQGR